MCSFRYFCILFIKKSFSCFVLLYKGLSKFLVTPLTLEMFPACLITLDNLHEVCEWSILRDFIFNNIFFLAGNYFDFFFYQFCVFSLQIKIMFALALSISVFFSIILVARNRKSFLFCYFIE